MSVVGRVVGSVAGVVGIAVGGWVGAGVMLAGAALQYAFRKKPGLPSEVAQRQRAIKVNVSGTEASLPVVYGETIVGGKIIDVRTDPTDSKSLAVVVAFNLAGEAAGLGTGPIDEIYFDGELAIQAPVYESEPVTGASIQEPWRPSGGGTYGVDQFLQYGLHSGATTQVVDSELNSVFTAYGAAHEGVGIQYAVFWMYRSDDVYPGGIPAITAKVRGAQVFDPRSTTTIWQNGQNPILAARDFMLSDRYGMGLDTTEIDATSVTSEANYCDETVSVPGGTQNRFVLNGWIDPSQNPQANLNRILSCCRGRVVNEGGVYRFVIRRVKTAETFELTEENIIGISQYWKAGIREAPNVMAATYVDADRDHEMDEVQWPDPGAANSFLTEDNGQLVEAQIDLPLTPDRYQAQQTIQTLLKEARKDAGCVLTAKREALNLAHGDVVQVTHSTPGWTQKEFFVETIGLEFETGLVQLVLREYDSAVYTLDALPTKDSTPATGLPDPRADLGKLDIVIVDDRYVSQGEVAAAQGTESWYRRLRIATGTAVRSIRIQYDFDRPTVGGGSTNLARNYTVDVSPESLVTLFLEDGASANQEFWAQDDAGTTVYDEAFAATITSYSAAAGGGEAGRVVVTDTLNLDNEDDSGIRLDAEVDVAFDSYAESNGDAWYSMDDANNVQVAQAFVVPSGGRDISSTDFHLRAVGSPAGPIWVAIYSNNTTPTPDEPDTQQAVSTSIQANTITTAAAGERVRFELPEPTFAAGTWWAVLVFLAPTGTDYIDVRVDESSPAGTGDFGSSDELETWTVVSTRACAGFAANEHTLQEIPARRLHAVAEWRANDGVFLQQGSSSPAGGGVGDHGLTDHTDVMLSPLTGQQGDVLRRGTAEWENVGILVMRGDGAVGAPTFAWLTDPDTGWYLNAAGDVRLAVAGVDRFEVDEQDATHGRAEFSNVQVGVVEGAEVTRDTAGAVTLDWDAYNQVPLRNDGNIDTINIDDSSMVAGTHYCLMIRMATGGQASITFSASGTLNWQNGAAPTLPLTVGNYTAITFVRTGSVVCAYYADAT